MTLKLSANSDTNNKVEQTSNANDVNYEVLFNNIADDTNRTEDAKGNWTY